MSTLPEVEPHIEIFKRSKAYDMAVKSLINRHLIEFHYIMEGMKKKTGEA